MYRLLEKCKILAKIMLFFLNPCKFNAPTGGFLTALGLNITGTMGL